MHCNCPPASATPLHSDLEAASLALVGAEVAAGSAQWMGDSGSPRGVRVIEVMQAALALAEAGRAWKEGATVARHLCSQLMLLAGVQRGAQRVATIARAEEEWVGVWVGVVMGGGVWGVCVCVWWWGGGRR